MKGFDVQRPNKSAVHFRTIRDFNGAHSTHFKTKSSGKTFGKNILARDNPRMSQNEHFHSKNNSNTHPENDVQRKQKPFKKTEIKRRHSSRISIFSVKMKSSDCTSFRPRSPKGANQGSAPAAPPNETARYRSLLPTIKPPLDFRQIVANHLFHLEGRSLPR